MNKKQKQLKKNIKIFIVLLMALGILMSALLPIFASEGATMEDVQKAIDELTGKTENEEGSEEKIIEVVTRSEFEEKKEALWKEVEETGDIINGSVEELLKIPNTRTRKVAISGISKGFTFNNTLRQRVVGRDVRYLQILLNADPATRITSSGPGSPGRETELFGENTRSAIIRFQRKYGLPVSGDFLLETRNKANELLKNGVSVSVSTISEKEVYMAELRVALSKVRSIALKLEELRKLKEKIVEKEE